MANMTPKNGNNSKFNYTRAKGQNDSVFGVISDFRMTPTSPCDISRNCAKRRQVVKNAV